MPSLSRSPFGQASQPLAPIPGFRNVVPPSSQYFPSLINSQPLGAIAGINYDKTTRAIADYLRSLPSAGGQPSTATASSGAGAIPSSIGPINPLKLDKGGGFDQFSQDALARIKSATPDYTDVRSRIAAALTPTADEQATRADTEALIARYRAAAPGLTATTQTQADTLGRVFLPDNDPGSLAAQLATSRAHAKSAERAAARQAGLQALLQFNIRNSVEGTSSTNTAQLADLQARNAVDVAARSAERERADIGNVLSAQERIAGRPQDLITSDVLSGQIPIQARTQMLDTQARLAASRLQNLGIEVNLNNLTDQLTTIGRQLGLSSAALQQYLAANFLGVNSPSQPITFPQIGGGGGGGSGPNYFVPQAPFQPSSRIVTSPSPAPRQRTPAEEIYGQNAGVYPDQDSSYSPELYRFAQQQVQGNYFQQYPPRTEDERFSYGYTPDYFDYVPNQENAVTV